MTSHILRDQNTDLENLQKRCRTCQNLWPWLVRTFGLRSSCRVAAPAALEEMLYLGFLYMCMYT